jgi:hypothetical protein
MAIVQRKLGGFLSETSVMESEPQDDYKRDNTFGAVQVITDVATVRILREPAASDLLQTPRHRLHQHFICLPQHTHAESKMTLLIRVGWKRKKNTSFEIPKPLFLVSPSLCYDVVTSKLGKQERSRRVMCLNFQA